MKVWGSIALSLACVGCSTTAQVNSNQTATQIQNYTLQYEGQSENWRALLIVRTLNGTESDEITLAYKSSDRKSVGKIKGTFLLPTGGSLGGNGITLRQNGTCTFQGGGTATVPPDKDVVAEATVEWNGQKETFVMKPN